MHLALVLILSLTLAAQAQTPSAPPAIDAKALVARAVQNRIDADAHHHPDRYLFHKIDAHQDTTKEIVETKDGDVARLVAIAGKPVSPEVDRAELDRLDNLLQHPELQEHRHKSEQKDAARIDRLMRLLPDAFLYQVLGAIPCNAVASGPPSQCYRLSFKPNPSWDPPDMEASVFRGVAGEALIQQSTDPTQVRLTRIDAHFIADVDFGLGLLGRLHKGSTALIEQTDVGTAGAHDWELTTLKLNITGKALLFKSLNFDVDERASHFAPVAPNLTYRDAIKLLEASTPPEPTTQP